MNVQYVWIVGENDLKIEQLVNHIRNGLLCVSSEMMGKRNRKLE